MEKRTKTAVATPDLRNAAVGLIQPHTPRAGELFALLPVRGLSTLNRCSRRRAKFSASITGVLARS